jgi:predicted lipid carrier protein YhbT
VAVAEVDAVRSAILEVVRRLDELEHEHRHKIPDRTVSVVVTDLDLSWSGRFVGGHLVDVAEIDPAAAPDAHLRLRMDSDVLLDLVEDRLGFAHGWAKGQIRVDARLRDLLELRRFL